MSLLKGDKTRLIQTIKKIDESNKEDVFLLTKKKQDIFERKNIIFINKFNKFAGE